MKPLQSTLPDAAIAALKAGRDVEAIKIVREHAGVSLAQAKDAVAAHRAGESARVTVGTDDSIPLAAIGMLEAGDLIGAIRATRSTSGIGLKDAKHRVERYLDGHPASRERFRAAAAASHSGVVRGVVVVIAILVAIYAGVVLRN